MTEELLDNADVRSPFEEMRGERVPERVRGHATPGQRLRTVSLHEGSDVAYPERPTLAVEEQRDRPRWRYSRMASTAKSDIGTSRSFEPLPNTRTRPWSRSIRSSVSALTSPARRPDPYNSSRTARSRSATARPTLSCEPGSGASTSPAASAGLSTVGSRLATFGRPSMAAGSAFTNPLAAAQR